VEEETAYKGLGMELVFYGFKTLNIMKTAKEYIEFIDQHGQEWSNDSNKIADVMEDYAKMYHEHQLKLLDIADIERQKEQLVCRYCGSKHILKDNWCDDCGRLNRPLAN